MANLSPVEVAAYALRAGFRGQNAATAVAVSQAENVSGSTTAQNHNSNGSVDVGLWQINSSNANPSAMTDPLANAQEAFRLSSSGRGWNNWTNFRNKKYLLFLPIAEAAVLAAQARHPDLGVEVAGTTPIDKSTLLPGQSPNPQQPSIVDEFRAVIDAFNRIGSWVSNPQNWTRVLLVGVGGALTIVAISAISRPVTEPAIKAAAKVVK
jgi:Lysozyme like domain